MKRFLLNLMFAVFIGAFLYSCAEESTKPPVNDTTNKYFPLTVGSWWTYTNYELDDDGNKVVDSEFSSKYITGGTEMKGEKEAYIFNIQDLSGNKIEDSKFYYATKTQIFEFSKLLPPLDFSLPIDVPETWYKTADENGTEWTLFTQDLDQVEFPFSGFTVILDDVFDIKVKYEGMEDITYGTNMDKSVSTKKYKISYTFGGTASFSGFPIEIPFTVESIQYYAVNIGLVKHVMNPMVIELMGTEYFRMQGSEQILLEYNIAE